MDPLGANELGVLAADAVASNRSMRWLEAYTLEILAIVPKEVWQGNPAALPQTMLSDASSQTQPATPVRNAPESQRYARMYASSYAIIQRLSYDISLAATEVSNRIRSEGLHVNSTTVRCQFLEGLASIAYKFTQPNLSAGLRLAYFEMLKENIEGISERFNSFSQRIIMERVEAATREAFHHLQQLAFQFRMESDLLTQILKRPEELVQNRIVDHADPRVEWFIK
jgi:hypothetical protein